MSARRPFLTAEWRYLAMLNYEITPEVLTRFLPRGTELDTDGGKTYVSVVGFRFLSTRLLGWPIPFHGDFEELNLRFYVRRIEGATVKRGVVFVREIVPRWAIARTARLAYNEPYVALPMGHRIELAPGTSDPLRVEYTWSAEPHVGRLMARCEGDALPLIEGSHAQFIAEHYWGYAMQRDGGTVEYEVAHPPWRIWTVNGTEFNADVAELYGREFVEVLKGKPASAFVAEGSAVTVFRPRRIE